MHVGRSNWALRLFAESLEDKLTNRELTWMQPQWVGAEVIHLEDDMTGETCMDCRSSEMHD